MEALTKAQPRDLDATEIDVRLGATWISPDVIQKFMNETFQIPFYLRYAIRVKFSPATAEWRIEGKTKTNRNDVIAYETFGTARASAYKILEDTLNLRDARVYDTVEDDSGKPKRVLNKKETMLAGQKQQAIKDAFANWVWQDPQRRESLIKQYNELFNSTRPREYDGSHIHFVGMNLRREHPAGPRGGRGQDLRDGCLGHGGKAAGAVPEISFRGAEPPDPPVGAGVFASLPQRQVTGGVQEGF